MYQTFFKRCAILSGKRPFCIFESLWGLVATYDDYLRLIGRRVVDFLLVLIDFFSLGVTAEALRANIGSKSAISRFSPQRGPVDPKFLVEVVAPTNHSSSQKTKRNVCSFVWYKNLADLSFVCQTNERTLLAVQYYSISELAPCWKKKTKKNSHR